MNKKLKFVYQINRQKYADLKLNQPLLATAFLFLWGSSF